MSLEWWYEVPEEGSSDGDLVFGEGCNPEEWGELLKLLPEYADAPDYLPYEEENLSL